MLQNSRNSKIPDFDLATLRHKDVLGFQITMKNFTVVDVLDC